MEVLEGLFDRNACISCWVCSRGRIQLAGAWRRYDGYSRIGMGVMIFPSHIHGAGSTKVSEWSDLFMILVFAYLEIVTPSMSRPVLML